MGHGGINGTGAGRFHGALNGVRLVGFLPKRWTRRPT
jgi:hypothetical protein